MELFVLASYFSSSLLHFLFWSILGQILLSLLKEKVKRHRKKYSKFSRWFFRQYILFRLESIHYISIYHNDHKSCFYELYFFCHGNRKSIRYLYIATVNFLKKVNGHDMHRGHKSLGEICETILSFCTKSVISICTRSFCITA